jgi:hypothetical protein
MQPNLDESLRAAKPVLRVFLSESFEDADSAFKPVLKGGVAAEFDLASTEAASEGESLYANQVVCMFHNAQARRGLQGLQCGGVGDWH